MSLIPAAADIRGCHPPTKLAFLIALVDERRDLNTSVRLDTIESLFVAHITQK
jgi:hypothetical protein